MGGRMYLKRFRTLAGNVGHELVAIVTDEAIANARQGAEDARRRDAERVRRESAARERAARVAQSKAIWDAAEAWRLDLVERNRAGAGR